MHTTCPCHPAVYLPSTETHLEARKPLQPLNTRTEYLWPDQSPFFPKGMKTSMSPVAVPQPTTALRPMQLLLMETKTLMSPPPPTLSMKTGDLRLLLTSPGNRGPPRSADGLYAEHINHRPSEEVSWTSAVPFKKDETASRSATGFHGETKLAFFSFYRSR